MDPIPYSAVALAIGLPIIWFFLLDMTFSRTPNARLRILLDVITTKEEKPSGTFKPLIGDGFEQVTAGGGQAAREPCGSAPAVEPEGARRGWRRA